ncbi:MAG TPA: class I SAM-dependent methyltransferase [Planctomycetota bacterium]
MACPFCASRSSTTEVEGPDYEYACKPGTFTLRRCSDCGHVFIDPMPATSDIPALYPGTYYTINPASPLYLRGFVYRVKLKGDVRRLLSYAGAEPPRSVVDIGCGDAARLLALKKALPADAEAVGVDLQFTDEAARRAAEAGARLAVGNVESDLSALRDGGHDLIILSQLIEHLREPERALRLLRDKLSPRGRLVIETPDLAGLDYRLFRSGRWGGYHLPRHFHLFTKRSLADLLRRGGYAVEVQRNLPSPGFWIISLRNALGLSSDRRRASLWEPFLHFANLPVVGFFAALDVAFSALGGGTSNQVAVAKKA